MHACEQRDPGSKEKKQQHMERCTFPTAASASASSKPDWEVVGRKGPGAQAVS